MLREADLQGKMVIISLDFICDNLKSTFKNPLTRAFKCESGFGCNPSSIGTAIFGTWTYDGEQCRMRRSDFERLATPEEVKQLCSPNITYLQ